MKNPKSHRETSDPVALLDVANPFLKPRLPLSECLRTHEMLRDLVTGVRLRRVRKEG